MAVKIKRGADKVCAYVVCIRTVKMVHVYPNFWDKILAVCCGVIAHIAGFLECYILY